MKNENKRIFISDLPETVTQDELTTNFSKFGQVSSVEIKERKKLGPNNKSLFYAYVNVVTDDKGINHCFKELSNKEWHGQYIQLQLARESFLERLKREREDSQRNNHISSDIKDIPIKPVTKDNVDSSKKGKSTFIKDQESIYRKDDKKHNLSFESEGDSSESESSLENDLKIHKIEKKAQDTKIEVIAGPEEKLDIVIKNNRGKIVDKSGLKIPSVGKEPIVKVTKTKMKLNDSEANLKRLQSLQNMKKSYAAQKSLIKNSLSYAINKPNTKIVFDDNDGAAASAFKTNGVQKNTPFEDRSDDSDFEVNIEVKEQFQGKSGQKLSELQSKYKNDKRFALDKRFIDDEMEPMDTEETTEETLEAEKRAQLKILEEVLGRKGRPSKDQNKKDSDKKKAMLRFDPARSDHSNLELTVIESEEKKKKNKKQKQEAQEDIKPEPEVSKEVFYKVTDNLKETLEEKQQFSLLSMFGKVEDQESKEKDNEENTEKEIKRNPILKGQNPFKYDSSDDENDEEDIPHKDQTANVTQNTSEQKTTRASPAVFWTEPFFFKKDDFRLQEGLDFIEKIKTESREFVKTRRDLKGIVKAKIRNNERKNKMFKKKLGGSKRRKHIRMRKALKR